MGNMQTQYSSQNSFLSGDVDPRFFDRYDLRQFGSFASTTTNMYPVISGSMTRRPGTEFFNTSKTNNPDTKFYEFIFNNVDFLALEFGNLYIRFHKSNGTVAVSGSPYEVTTPYTTSEVKDLKFAQINDVVIIVHPNHAPRRLRRIADNNWTLTTLTFRDGPYEEINSSSTTLTLTGTYPNFTVTSSSNLFTANDVGRFVRVQIPSGASAGRWFYSTITAYTSATQVSMTTTTSIGSAYPTGTATDVWRLGAFYTGNYPQHVSFFQNRVVFGKTTTQPSSIWMSVTGDINLYAPTQIVNGVDEILATSGISASLSSRSAASIQFMASEDVFMIGTESGLFVSNSETITPANFSMRISNNTPLSSIRPSLVKGSLLAVSQLKNQIYAFTYSDEQKSYVEEELTLYWQHLIDDKIKDLKYVSYPTPIVWITLESGKLLSMVYDPSQKAVGVTAHEIIDSEVIDVFALPNLTTGFDELWLYTSRNSTNYILKLDREYRASYYKETKPLNARFLDYFVKYSGGSTTTISGLTHLANETVSFIAQGRLGMASVNGSGVATLPFAVTSATIGLPYRSSMETVDAVFPETVGNDALSRSFKEVKTVKVSMFESFHCYIQAEPTLSPTIANLIENPTSTVVYDLLTGITHPVSVQSPTRARASFTLWIDDPLPLTITGIYFAVTPSHV
jgi:hypothetical protein